MKCLYTLGLLVFVGLSGVACDENQTLPQERAPYPIADADDVGQGPVEDTGQPLDCVPNLDGRIDSSEFQATLGVPVTYLVSAPGQTRAVNLEGEVNGDGQRVWDFSQSSAQDLALEISGKPLADQWYADSFPEGDFVLPSDSAGTLEAVYRRDEDALYLLGLASTQEAPSQGQTLLPYEAPVLLYRFPLAPGDQWVSVGEVRGGVLLDLPYAGQDIYEIEVDAAGVLELPDLSFTQALRVRQKVTLNPAVGQGLFRRQVSFLFECFGEVARATSQDNEPDENFVQAAELRRLGLE